MGLVPNEDGVTGSDLFGYADPGRRSAQRACIDALAVGEGGGDDLALAA